MEVGRIRSICRTLFLVKTKLNSCDNVRHDGNIPMESLTADLQRKGSTGQNVV